jgi:Kef-type K+ transport system membrane component KefB
MRKVLWYSLLLVSGLIASQFLAGRGARIIELLTMVCLSFIVMRIAYGFELSRDKPQKYFWDYLVGTSTTVFPWLFCALYFVFVMAPEELWWKRDMWWEAIIIARFAAPTSVGLLFSMLSAAGLAETWLYRKARLLAIFDDIDTILLVIPIKVFFLKVNLRPVVLAVVVIGLIWVAWKYVRFLKVPATWPWAMLYSAGIVAASEGINLGGKALTEDMPVTVEAILLAFMLGSILARSRGRSHPSYDPENQREQSASVMVSACFMALTGLSLPGILSPALAQSAEGSPMAIRFAGVPPEVLAQKDMFPGWGVIAIHVLVVSVVSNIGKMFPALCYRREADRRQRLALAIGMFPRGEVGAGMLVLSLSYGVHGPALTVAVLSLALNLLSSGLFVVIIKKLASPKS